MKSIDPVPLPFVDDGCFPPSLNVRFSHQAGKYIAALNWTNAKKQYGLERIMGDNFPTGNELADVADAMMKRFEESVKNNQLR